MRIALILLMFMSLSFGKPFLECLENSIEMERALEIARQHSGEPYKVWITKSKRTGECYWKVKGTKGYVILDAKTGEIIRFYRNRR